MSFHDRNLSPLAIRTLLVTNIHFYFGSPTFSFLFPCTECDQAGYIRTTIAPVVAFSAYVYCDVVSRTTIVQQRKLDYYYLIKTIRLNQRLPCNTYDHIVQYYSIIGLTKSLSGRVWCVRESLEVLLFFCCTHTVMCAQTAELLLLDEIRLMYIVQSTSPARHPV